jgi:hypothetical protein
MVLNSKIDAGGPQRGLCRTVTHSQWTGVAYRRGGAVVARLISFDLPFFFHLGLATGPRPKFCGLIGPKKFHYVSWITHLPSSPLIYTGYLKLLKYTTMSQVSSGHFEGR